jgi:hypothetical protein
MPGILISHPSQITLEWLNQALAASGALQEGAVTSFALEQGQGNWSTSARLRVHYSANARGELPQRLFVKMVGTDLEDESFGDSEVTYYTRDYAGLADAPLIRCYDAVYAADQMRYHLLLADVSETHTVACNQEPTLEYGLALAEGLAVMHAHWWGAARLAEAGAAWHDAAHIQRFVDIAAPGVRHVLPRFEPHLQPHWPQLIRTIFKHHPQALIERAQDANGFTLIHGDAGCYNILVPHRGVRPVYLIDRQPFNWSLTTWLGVYDLFYVMILDWEPALCRQLEGPVLRHYHARLQALGVSGYTWERLWNDYRLCAAMGVYIAVEYARGGVIEDTVQYWLPMLQHSLAACDALDVLALI